MNLENCLIARTNGFADKAKLAQFASSINGSLIEYDNVANIALFTLPAKREVNSKMFKSSTFVKNFKYGN